MTLLLQRASSLLHRLEQRITPVLSRRRTVDAAFARSPEPSAPSVARWSARRASSSSSSRRWMPWARAGRGADASVARAPRGYRCYHQAVRRAERMF